MAPTEQAKGPGRVALLDVNVLLALLDRQHMSHGLVSSWFRQHHSAGWASCPITQNGFFRILTQPKYTNPTPAAHALRMLQAAIAMPSHRFWADDVSIADTSRFDHTRLHGHRQLTDAFLLGLAVKNAGYFVSLDQNLPLSAVVGATSDDLVVL